MIKNIKNLTKSLVLSLFLFNNALGMQEGSVYNPETEENKEFLKNLEKQELEKEKNVAVKNDLDELIEVQDRLGDEDNEDSDEEEGDIKIEKFEDIGKYFKSEEEKEKEKEYKEEEKKYIDLYLNKRESFDKEKNQTIEAINLLNKIKNDIKFLKEYIYKYADMIIGKLSKKDEMFETINLINNRINKNINLLNTISLELKGEFSGLGELKAKLTTQSDCDSFNKECDDQLNFFKKDLDKLNSAENKAKK